MRAAAGGRRLPEAAATNPEAQAATTPRLAGTEQNSTRSTGFFDPCQPTFQHRRFQLGNVQELSTQSFTNIATSSTNPPLRGSHSVDLIGVTSASISRDLNRSNKLQQPATS